METSRLQRRISRILQWVGEVTSRAGTTAAITAALAIYLVVVATAGHRASWEAGFAVTTESITLVMLFVIQHTQSRQQIAIQLKLDELIRTSPRADDHLVHIELAQEDELIEREKGQVAHHEAVRAPINDVD
ncbi:MAG: low affinity iron permease family protein [Acidimicrobiales bacterium]